MKYLFVLTAFLTTIGYSSCVTCSDEAKEYSKVEFDMKIEKIPNYRKSRNIILEGKDKNGNNIRCQDFNIWLNNNIDKLSVGDSIKKEKGKLILIIKNNITNEVTIIPFDCGDKVPARHGN